MMTCRIPVGLMATILAVCFRETNGQAPFCSDGVWACQSDQPSMGSTAASIKNRDTCYCFVQPNNAIAPKDYVQACATAGAFAADIVDANEMKVVDGIIQNFIQYYPAMYPLWIGLTKGANGEYWDDQCTNSTPSYTNYAGAGASGMAGAYYAMASTLDWTGYAADASAGVKTGVCRKDKSPCGRNLCKSGSTCTTANGNCFTCTCPAGYSGRYCDQTGSTAPPTVATLPSCSETGGSYPSCIPDQIETGCDIAGVTSAGVTCTPKTTVSTKSSSSVLSATVSSKAAAVQNDVQVTPQQPATVAAASSSNTNTGGCETWIKCHLYWVILAVFACGIMLIAIIGLMYSFCCKPQPATSSSTVEPVYPMHEPPPSVA